MKNAKMIKLWTVDEELNAFNLKFAKAFFVEGEAKSFVDNNKDKKFRLTSDWYIKYDGKYYCASLITADIIIKDIEVFF